MGHKIKITITNKGIEYEVEGIKGEKCTEVTKFIDRLANKIESTKKDEYYETEVETETINEGIYYD